MGKNNIVAVITGVCLGLVATAHASLLGVEGSGSLKTRTADMLARGDAYVDLMAGTESYIVNGNNRDVEMILAPQIVFGFSDNLDLALSAVHVTSDASTQGLRSLTGIAKYRLWQDESSRIGLSLSAYDDLYTATSTAFGSGDGNYGAALNLSVSAAAAARYHFLFGSERSDQHVAGTASYLAKNRLIAGAGIEMRPLPDLEMSVEALASRIPGNQDNNMLLMPSLRYQPAGRVAYNFGLAYGFPGDRSSPEYRFTAGLSVGLDRPERRRHRIAVASEDDKQSVAKGRDDSVVDSGSTMDESRLARHVSALSENQATMQRNIDLLSRDQTALRDEVEKISDGQSTMMQQLGGIEKDIKNLSITSGHGLARIEVENASGIKGLGERVAEILMRKGYEVTSVTDAPKLVSRPTKIFYTGGAGKTAEVVRVARADLAIKHQTRIFYIEGFVQRATRVSMILPGSQAIVPDKKLKNDVEIRVVVGKDMRALVLPRPSA